MFINLVMAIKNAVQPTRLKDVDVQAIVELFCPLNFFLSPKKYEKWLCVLDSDQMILECTRRPKTV